MREVLEKMRQCLQDGRDTVLVSVIAGSGSTPRGSGARMLVMEDKTSVGTIGGGNVEYTAQKMAAEVLKKRVSFSRGYNLVPNEAADLGMVCGGNVTVYFQFIPGGSEEMLTLCLALLAQLNLDEDSWIITDITDETAWSMGMYSRSKGLVGLSVDGGACDAVASDDSLGAGVTGDDMTGAGAASGGVTGDDVAGAGAASGAVASDDGLGADKTGAGMAGDNMAGRLEPLLGNKGLQVTIGDRRYYSEPLVQAGTVYVFGGGHVAQETVPVLARLGFRCVVLDDREDFASPRLFPDAVQTILCDFAKLKAHISMTDRDYAVVMSRGHLSDYVIEKQLLRGEAGYIGVMGSRKKTASINAKLYAEGFTEEDTARIHTPIGLKIGAETPAEIAISVAAELIMVRAGRRA